VAFVAAISIRFETIDLRSVSIVELPSIACVVFFSQVTCFYLTGLYRGVWRFSSTHDLVRVLKGATLGVLLSIVGVFLFNRLETVPRSAFIIDWLLLVMGLGGGRFIYRIWKDLNVNTSKETKGHSKRTKVLIVGAGVAGNKIAKDIISNPSLNLKIVGFIDDNPFMSDRLLNNVKVVGNSSQLPLLIKTLGAEKVIIAIPSATGEEIKNIVRQCEHSKVEFKILPKISHLLSDRVSVSLLRNIKLEDLLGREPIRLEQDFVKGMIEGKTVLVSGSGGSIGSELCRQLTQFDPLKIILLEISEFFLYQVEQEFIEKFPEVEIVSLVGDVRNRERVDSIFDIYRPELVIHAAAYKHVPMMEKNPIEAIRTNILGTYILSEIAIKYSAEKFVMISTDKAVNPTNIMGASKRIAEMVCRKRHESKTKTSFITVRFGNVLGSNGSVIPLFQKMIEEGKDLPVTHPDIERFFMSIPEACQLVLQAASMGDGGEIFVLDMGNPVKIMDLAKEMIKLAGLELGKDINIKIVGLRPGEKLYEELFSSDENLYKTKHEKVKVAESRGINSQFDELLATLITLPINSDFHEISKNLKKILPEFSPDSEKELFSRNIN
jgi:FlaA1/EpsC-like NDP-sugar epimerase